MSVLGAPGDDYPTLTNAEQQRLERTLKGHYSGANDVLSRIRSWKYNSGNFLAARHEKNFRDALGYQSPLRGSVPNWSPTKSEMKVARRLHKLSKEIVEYEHGSSFTLYRGLSYEGPLILQRYLESRLQKSIFNPGQSALSNYTHSKYGAREFYPLVVCKRSMTPEDIALAANYLFTYQDPFYNLTNSNNIVSPNGELRVRGDREHPIHLNELQVLVPNGGQKYQCTSLSSFFNKGPDFNTASEHEVMRQFVESMVGRVNVGSTFATSFLNDWQAYYTKNTNHTAQNAVQKVTGSPP